LEGVADEGLRKSMEASKSEDEKKGNIEGKDSEEIESKSQMKTAENVGTASEEAQAKTKDEAMNVPTSEGIHMGENTSALLQQQQQQQQQQNSLVNMEVLVMPEKFRVMDSFDPLLSMKQVRLILCKKLSIPFTRLGLETREGRPMKDSMYLTEFFAERDVVLQVVATLLQPKSVEYKMPSVIDVMVDSDVNGHPVVVKVQIESEDTKKKYFGGYRDKRNGLVYHHACTQTTRKPKESKIAKFHRETQTVDLSTKSVQSKREQGTQMARKDLFIDTANDKIIASQPYFTTEELISLKKEKALAIQCFIRQCFAWRKVAQFYHQKRNRLIAEKKKKELDEKLAKEAEQDKINRRMNPKSKADFDALYKELEAWKRYQEKSIRDEGGTDEQIAQALKELLHKEIKLLQTIDKLKIKARSAVKEERIKARLELMASPKEWLTAQGDYIEVVTPVTTRASELVQLYNGLKLRKIPARQRLDIILNVKFTVREFDCLLTRDIVELVNREQDMVSRGRSESSLSGLRLRLENLFLNFIETPEFNPGATNFQRAPYVTNKRTKLMTKAATALYARKVP